MIAAVEPFFTSDVSVKPIAGYGGDWLVCDAARVSSGHEEGAGERDCDNPRDRGLIKALIQGRHGGPFGHGGLTFYVEAPIFVFREWRTHRVYMSQTTDDFSYSESSARYKPVEGRFWLPKRSRLMVKADDYKPMRPKFALANIPTYNSIAMAIRTAYVATWRMYQTLLTMEVAPEVARAILPVGLYSSMYVSCNPRSLMHFLGLRISSMDSAVPTYPQLEMQLAAEGAERMFAEGWPIVYEHWIANGRQSV